MKNPIYDYILDNTPQDIVDRYIELPELVKKIDFKDLDQDIVVIDTETTGVSLKKDELTQIAAARLSKGEIKEWFVTFVNPKQPISSDISHLTNIYDEDVANAPTPDIALEQLVNFVGDSKLVAHNANFDKNFVTKHPQGYPLLNNIWIDSLDLAKISLPRMKSHRLIDLVKAFDAPISTHRADADVTALCALYEILLAAIYQMPNPLLKKITELTTPVDWQTQIIFEEILKLKISNDETETFSLKKLREKRLILNITNNKKDAAYMFSSEVLNNSEIKLVNESENEIEYLKFPSHEEIYNAFSNDGCIGKVKNNYELRQEQADMSIAVRDALAENKNLVIEAGTGVGKSLAYLLPAALLAKQNNITVGIATKTNALLDQLIYKDLPIIDEAIGGLDFVPLKGFSHYLCLLKIQDVINIPAQIKLVFNEERNQAPSIAAMLSFIEQSAYDDIDNLKIDYRVLTKKSITTTSHDCLHRKCPFFNNGCFVLGARKLAQNADVVVTNHSLLFSDIATDNALLPPIRYWIVDEAHNTEKEARHAFEKKISDYELRLLSSKTSSEDSKKNIYKKAARILGVEGSANNNSLFYSLLSKNLNNGKAFKEKVEEFIALIPGLLYFDTQKKSSYDLVEIWINDEVRNSERFKKLKGQALVLQDAVEKLISDNQSLIAYLDDEEKASVIQREIAGLTLDLKDLYSSLDCIFINSSEKFVYSASLHKRADKGENTIIAQPYNVGEILNETLYLNTHSVVYTSATITIDGSFKPFEMSLGLNQSINSKTTEVEIASSYDFDKNMKVFIVEDICDPLNSDYIPQLINLSTDIHIAQNGSILTLFTNKKEMEQCYSHVKDEVEKHGLRLLCQKGGVSVKGLRDDFINDETLSLFALKSFWEGFDAPGATLKAVVIPKLPFSKPSDPLSRERVSRDDQAWKHFVLPQAVIEVKQAAGRLLRRSDDTGVLIIADSRIVTKGYGKTFISSLPSKNITIGKMQDLPNFLKTAKFL